MHIFWMDNGHPVGVISGPIHLLHNKVVTRKYKTKGKYELEAKSNKV